MFSLSDDRRREHLGVEGDRGRLPDVARVKVALFDVGIEEFDPVRVKVTSSRGTVTT